MVLAVLVKSRLVILWYVVIGLMIVNLAIMAAAGQMAHWCRQKQWDEFNNAANKWQKVEGLPFAAIINDCGKTHQVSPELIAAVIQAESSFRPKAVSPAGAYGLMQIIPGTWEDVNRRTGICSASHGGSCTTACYFDPKLNIMIGTAYLREMLDLFQGDAVLAVAAYNAGPGAVQKHKTIPPYRETREYVVAVIANSYALAGKEPLYSKAIIDWERAAITGKTAMVCLIGGAILLAGALKRRYRSWRWR